MSGTPTLGEAIGALVEHRLEDVHVATPAKVLEYDRTTQRMTAQPLIKRGYIDEDGVRQVKSLPAITNVPVVFPGAGGISITFPIAAGDTVLLVFSEFSLDKWLQTGAHSDPLDDRRHALSDAIAIPGLRPFSAPVDSTHATAMVIDAPLIHAGGTSSLAFDSSVDAIAARLASVESWITANLAYLGGVGASSYAGTSVLKGS